MKLLFLVIGVMIFSGCSKSAIEPDIEFKPPKYVEEMPSREVEDNENLGSLFGKGDNPPFEEGSSTTEEMKPK